MPSAGKCKKNLKRPQHQKMNCLNMPVMATQLLRLFVPHSTMAALGWAPVPVCVGAELLGRIAAIHRLWGGLGIALFRYGLRWRGGARL